MLYMFVTLIKSIKKQRKKRKLGFFHLKRRAVEAKTAFNIYLYIKLQIIIYDAFFESETRVGYQKKKKKKIQTW